MDGARDNIIRRPYLLRRTRRQGQWQANQKLTSLHRILAVYEANEDQKQNADDRTLDDHADETSKGFFLNADIHFAVLVFSHNEALS